MMSAIRGRTGQKKSELGLGITHTGQAGSGSALDDSSFCAVFIINTLVIAGLFFPQRFGVRAVLCGRETPGVWPAFTVLSGICPTPIGYNDHIHLHILCLLLL